MTEEPEKKRYGHPDFCPVSHDDYMKLSTAIDEHSNNLMGIKGEEYSCAGDFLAMENRLAGMMGSTPEAVSLTMAGKHITSISIILEKVPAENINLAKWDERIRDAINLLKITSAFVHGKQNDFELKLGTDDVVNTTKEKVKLTPYGNPGVGKTSFKQQLEEEFKGDQL